MADCGRRIARARVICRTIDSLNSLSESGPTRTTLYCRFHPQIPIVISKFCRSVKLVSAQTKWRRINHHQRLFPTAEPQSQTRSTRISSSAPAHRSRIESSFSYTILQSSIMTTPPPAPSPPTGSSTPPTPISIFCFGDSLTAGWCDGGRTSFPYAPDLAGALNERAEGKRVKFRATALGLPGWTTGQLKELVEDTNPPTKLFCVQEREYVEGPTSEDRGPPVPPRTAGAHPDQGLVTPDLVIVMAGTNDIGLGRTHPLKPKPKNGDPQLAEQIAENLRFLHDTCLLLNGRGARKTIEVLIPLSVPADPGAPGQVLEASASRASPPTIRPLVTAGPLAEKRVLVNEAIRTQRVSV